MSKTTENETTIGIEEEKERIFKGLMRVLLNPADISVDIGGLVNKGMLDARAREPKRDYLGCSQIGNECMRKLQLMLEGKNEEVAPRSLRIFDLGHVLEDTIVKWLRYAGFEIVTQNADGQQSGFVAAAGKIAGHVDGIVTKSPLATLLTPCILECKTMNAANWKETVKRGVFVAKPTYYTQVQLYMFFMNIRNPVFFVALNKDTAELYCEMIPYDHEYAERARDKGLSIVDMTKNNEMASQISADATFYQCKMCGYRHICHGKKCNGGIVEE